MLFDWLRDYGFVQLDDANPCVFKLVSPDGEILTIGVYVDNLQIVHSVALDASGRGPTGCAYNEFMDALSSDHASHTAIAVGSSPEDEIVEKLRRQWWHFRPQSLHRPDALMARHL